MYNFLNIYTTLPCFFKTRGVARAQIPELARKPSSSISLGAVKCCISKEGAAEAERDN